MTKWASDEKGALPTHCSWLYRRANQYQFSRKTFSRCRVTRLTTLTRQHPLKSRPYCIRVTFSRAFKSGSFKKKDEKLPFCKMTSCPTAKLMRRLSVCIQTWPFSRLMRQRSSRDLPSDVMVARIESLDPFLETSGANSFGSIRWRCSVLSACRVSSTLAVGFARADH